MRIKIIYKIPDDQGQLGEEREDLVTWPDVNDLDEVQTHALVYLEHKYGVGHAMLIRVEES